MNLIYVLLYSISIIAIRFVSTAIRENKLYAISKNDSDNSFEVTVYELKDGSIKDIFSNGRSSSLTKLERGYDLKFFDVPNNLQESRNKLWLKAEQTSPDAKTSSKDSSLMGYINLNSLAFKEDSSFIKFPAEENFPLFGYSMNMIANERESSIYVTGGVIYSKSKDAYVSSNSFFKYDFTTKKWDDMSSYTKGKLKPVFNHTSVVIDKTLVLIGGKIAKDPTKDTTLNISEDGLFKINSIYNLTRFDTVTNNWENKALNTSMFDSSVASLQLTEFSANFYNNKIYALGGLATSNEKQTPDRNTKLGILDYKAYLWSWSPVFDDAGNIYNSPIEAKNSLLFNDQIILTSGKSVDKDSDAFQIFSSNSQRMQSTLKLTKSDRDNSDQANGQSALPGYAIALIAVGSTILLLITAFFAYTKYKRSKKSSLDYDNEPNESLEAFFSEPKEPDMEYILLGIKRDGIYFNTDIWYSGWIWENPIYEKANVTQVYLPPSPGSTGTSATLYSDSSNFQRKKLQDSTLIEFNN